MRDVVGWKRVVHCPQCRETLQPGTLMSRSRGLGFVPERAPNLELSLAADDGELELRALRCERCGTVVIPGS